MTGATAVLSEDHPAFRRVWDGPVLVDPDFPHFTRAPLQMWQLLDPKFWLTLLTVDLRLGDTKAPDSGLGGIVRVRNGQTVWTWRQTSIAEEPTNDTITRCDAGECPSGDRPILRIMMLLAVIAYFCKKLTN